MFPNTGASTGKRSFKLKKKYIISKCKEKDQKNAQSSFVGNRKVK